MFSLYFWVKVQINQVKLIFCNCMLNTVCVWIKCFILLYLSVHLVVSLYVCNLKINLKKLKITSIKSFIYKALLVLFVNSYNYLGYNVAYLLWVIGHKNIVDLSSSILTTDSNTVV